MLLRIEVIAQNWCRGGEPRQRTRLEVIRPLGFWRQSRPGHLPSGNRLDNESHTLGARLYATAAGEKIMARTTYRPGTPTPRSGIYEQVGPRGGRTGEQIDSTQGNPLPPTDKHGQEWILVMPAHHKSGK